MTGVLPKVTKKTTTIKDKFKTAFQEWLDMSLCEESFSNFNNPLLCVFKKNAERTLKIAVDARFLNENSMLDKFPMPSQQNILAEMACKIQKGPQCFISTFDCVKGYHQLLIDPKDTNADSLH